MELLFIINLFSTILKAISVTGTNATSVFIDVLNDIGDTLGLGLLLLGLYYEKRHSSILYPYGVRRALYVLGLISISIFSGLIFSIAISKTMSLFNGLIEIHTSISAIYLFTIAFTLNTLGLLILTYYSSRGINDPSINPGILDSISDTVGSALALLSIILMSTLLDVVGSLILSIVILISAFTIGYRYFQVLIGRAPPGVILKKILEKIMEMRDVRDVNVFNAVMITEDEYMLILEIEVDRDLGVEDLEKLNDEIEREVKRIDPRFKHVIVEFVAERREPKTYKKILSEIENSVD